MVRLLSNSAVIKISLSSGGGGGGSGLKIFGDRVTLTRNVDDQFDSCFSHSLSPSLSHTHSQVSLLFFPLCCSMQLQLAGRRLLPARVAEAKTRDDREETSRQNKRVPRRAAEVSASGGERSSQRQTREGGDLAAHRRALANASEQR